MRGLAPARYCGMLAVAMALVWIPTHDSITAWSSSMPGSISCLQVQLRTCVAHNGSTLWQGVQQAGRSTAAVSYVLPFVYGAYGVLPQGHAEEEADVEAEEEVPNLLWRRRAGQPPSLHSQPCCQRLQPRFVAYTLNATRAALYLGQHPLTILYPTYTSVHTLHTRSAYSSAYRSVQI